MAEAGAGKDEGKLPLDRLLYTFQRAPHVAPIEPSRLRLTVGDAIQISAEAGPGQIYKTQYGLASGTLVALTPTSVTVRTYDKFSRCCLCDVT